MLLGELIQLKSAPKSRETIEAQRPMSDDRISRAIYILREKDVSHLLSIVTCEVKGYVNQSLWLSTAATIRLR